MKISHRAHQRSGQVRNPSIDWLVWVLAGLAVAAVLAVAVWVMTAL